MPRPVVIETPAMRTALEAFASARESLARSRPEGLGGEARQQSAGPLEENLVLRRMRCLAGEGVDPGETHAELGEGRG